MQKALTSKNVLDKKFNTVKFTGIWFTVFGLQILTGIWIIYGKEKNGKTWGTLLIAKYLSQFTKVLYVSAEEGTEMEFQAALNRAGITPKDKINFIEYEPIEVLKKRLKMQRAPKIVVLDNLTIYNDEIKGKGIAELKQEFPNVLFIYVAHEERNAPYTAAARMASKLCKVRIRVEGLALFCAGRIPGGVLMIDEAKAMLYHGTEINKAK